MSKGSADGGSDKDPRTDSRGFAQEKPSQFIRFFRFEKGGAYQGWTLVPTLRGVRLPGVRRYVPEGEEEQGIERQVHEAHISL